MCHDSYDLSISNSPPHHRFPSDEYKPSKAHHISWSCASNIQRILAAFTRSSVRLVGGFQCFCFKEGKSSYESFCSGRSGLTDYILSVFQGPGDSYEQIPQPWQGIQKLRLSVRGCYYRTFRTIGHSRASDSSSYMLVALVLLHIFSSKLQEKPSPLILEDYNYRFFYWIICNIFFFILEYVPHLLGVGSLFFFSTFVESVEFLQD